MHVECLRIESFHCIHMHCLILLLPVLNLALSYIKDWDHMEIMLDPVLNTPVYGRYLHLPNTCAVNSLSYRVAYTEGIPLQETNRLG